jgi:hypothetical protein
VARETPTRAAVFSADSPAETPSGEGVFDGRPTGFLAYPGPRDPSVRWVLARLYLGAEAVALEALPVARFAMRYAPAGEAADPVN